MDNKFQLLVYFTRVFLVLMHPVLYGWATGTPNASCTCHHLTRGCDPTTTSPPITGFFGDDTHRLTLCDIIMPFYVFCATVSRGGVCFPCSQVG